ncbi:MAG: hypothetical protein JNK04_04270 [Myxococcales bacterium]|nr:hypothetical protein [Myxococcales bacterium]
MATWVLRSCSLLAAVVGCDSAVDVPAAAPPPAVESIEIAAMTASPVAQPSTSTSTPQDSRRYRMDDIQLGDSYASVMGRGPYREPCDNDPIDNDARRFMVYAAKPCRERSFPEQTTVLFYLAFAKQDRYAQPIEAMAWLGGTYFDKRSDFPAAIGLTPVEAEAKLGRAVAELELQRGGQLLKVRQHPGDVYSVALADKIVGYVIGPMPVDAKSEQWRGLAQMYFRYTAPDAAIQSCCIALGRRALESKDADARAYLDAKAVCEQLEMATDGISRLGEARTLVGKQGVPPECR